MESAEGAERGETEGVTAKAVSDPAADKGGSTPLPAKGDETAKETITDANAASEQEARLQTFFCRF